MRQRLTLADLAPTMRADAAVQMGANAPRGAKPRKYRNVPVEVDGLKFDSCWEATRHAELCNQASAGLITELRRQVPFALEAWTIAGPVRLGAYWADFVYVRDGKTVIEDAKSAATRKDKTYQWKKKHLEAQYRIAITEVERIKKS